MEPGDDHSKTLVKSTMREQLCRGVNHQLQMYLNHDHDDCLDSAAIVLTIALERAINKLESSAQILWDAGEKIYVVLKQAECLIIYQQDKLFDIYKRFEKDLERCLKIPLPAISIGKNKLRSFSASFRILHAAVIILSMNNIPDDVESNYLVAIYARLKQEVDQYLQEWSAQNDFLLQSQFKLDATEAPDNLDLLQKYVLEEDAQANSEYLKRYRDMGVIHSPTGMHPWAKQEEAVKSEKQGMLKAKPKCRTEQDYVLEDDSEYRRRYRDLGAIHAPTEMQLAKKEAEESCVYKQGMWKTELCNKWKETGICPYGDNCRFAHGNKELRQVERHPRYKAELCRYVLNGAICPFAHRCHFRHTFTYKEKLVRAASLQPPR